MKSHQLIFALLLCTVYIFVSSVTENNKMDDDPIKLSPLHISDNPEKIQKVIDEIKLKENSDPQEKNPIFTDAEVKEMELVFEQSPKEAQWIVSHLQDLQCLPGDENRTAIFFGGPGTGKTIMAKAIVYKMMQQGWKCTILSSTSLIGEYRNQTSIKLAKELEIASKSQRPVIIVIDELNRLLENAESKHHDTDTTATALWTFLDKQKGNKNFFLIGTMNRIHRLPQPYKNRILVDCIHFPNVDDSAIKNKLLRTILINKKLQLDEEVTDTFLNEELQRIGSCTGRDLDNISRALGKKIRINNPNKDSAFIVTKSSISQVINEYLAIKAQIRYDFEDETDEERQERYHVENLKLQEKHHEDQMRLQKENQDMQEKHFVQQHMLQTFIADNQLVSTSNGDSHHFLSQKGKKEINSILSDEQKKLYEDTMKNTRTREEKEAAIAAQAKLEEAQRQAAERAKKRWW